MGQSFREQLAQNIALAQRVVTKIGGCEEHLFYRLTFCMWIKFMVLTSPPSPHLFFSSFLPIGDRAESHGDRTDHELLALR